MITYDNFYRRHGVRRPAQLLTPTINDHNTLELPFNAAFHYVGSGPTDAGPASNEFMFRNITRPIPVWFVTELGSTEGNPRPVPMAAPTIVRKWFTSNRRYRFIKEVGLGLRDNKVPLVYNYALLHRMFKYTRSLYSEYHKWFNIQATVWKNIAAACKESDRQHFIFVRLPKVLPGLTELRTATEAFTESSVFSADNQKYVAALEGFDDAESLSNEALFNRTSLALEAISMRTIKVFNSPEALMLLELWRWAGEHRTGSFLHEVPQNMLGRVNLVFEESGKWCLLNLGKFDEWRKSGAAEVAAGEAPHDKGFNPKQAQTFMLRFAMAVFQIRTGVVVANSEDTETTELEVGVQDVSVPDVSDTSTSSSSSMMQVDTGVLGDDDDDDAEITPAEAAQVEMDLAALDTMNEVSSDEETKVDESSDVFAGMLTPEDAVMRTANILAEDGMMSAAEYRKYQELGKKYTTILAPDGKQTLDKYIQVPAEDKVIKESKPIPGSKLVVDKTMLKSSLQTFDSQYIEKIMDKHVAAMVVGVQQAGICVTEYERETINDIMGSYYSYTVRLAPVEGAPSTVRFKLPVVDSEGTYTANGVKYRMRKQRGDMPIRKISPSSVALTSYYGKTFVSRSEKRVNDYGYWVTTNLLAKGLDDGDSSVFGIQPGSVFENSYKCPRLLSALMGSFREFSIDAQYGKDSIGKTKVRFILDRKKHQAEFSPEVHEAVSSIKTSVGKSLFLVGKTENHFTVVMDDDGGLYALQLPMGKGEPTLIQLPSIEDSVGLAANKAPVEFAVVKVMGKEIPVGFVLAYELGFENLMKILKVTPRRVLAGQRVNLAEDEFSIVFNDETLVFPKENKLATMMLAGFTEYHKAVRSFNAHEFDRRAVYLNVLEANGLGVRYLREISQLYLMFVDPITKDILEQSNLPTTFKGLLFKSAEMLLTDDHPDELDPAYMRIKGYERMAGAVYSEMVKAIRMHSGKNGKSRYPIDLNPFAVWKTIATDPAVAVVSDINPIENLKAMEAVTYSGVGGRNSRSMVKRMRAYHQNDMGTISEATKDSSDVGINIYTSADPQFDSIYGTSKRWDDKKRDLTSLLSTSALVSPGSDRDDPKRVNFVSIQHEHTLACNGYTLPAIRTGYEEVMAQRTGDMFATAAKQSGKVTALSDTTITVTYDDGSIKNVEIGRRYGHAGGLTVPQSIVTDMKLGQKVKEGDIIAYNTGFFEKDFLNPGGVAWKTSTTVTTALMESPDTLEDSSVISKRVSELLKTKLTKQRTIVVNFDQNVRKMVKVGDVLESEDILCIIEDAVSSNNALFDDESIETLRMLGAQAPAAKTKGVVERIEVFYHGEKEDMSDTLRALANASDREIGKRQRELGNEGMSGSVNESYRAESDPLALDTLAINIYITGEVGAGVGDKGVFCNQLKTVFGQVMPKEIKSESGKVVDAIFGQKSVYDRIVSSPYIIGTTTSLLKVIAKKMVEAYEK